MLRLQVVQAKDRELLWNINQKYLYEMTGFYDDPMDEKGNYHYGHFDEYFIDPKRMAYFIYCDDVLVGFAMLCPHSNIGLNPDYTMAEFTIFPSFRRRHFAFDAAKMILAEHPGKWEIKYNEKNNGGKKLWNTVAAPYDPEVYHLNEEETVLSFTTALSNPSEDKKIISTDRLYLREMNPDDYDALYAVLADPDIMQHYPYSFDEERVKAWIKRNMDRYRKDGFGLWAVCLKDTGEMIGDCGLTLQNINGEMLPEIGYHIRRDHQRKGYAKEASAAVRDWAFQNTDCQALYSYCKYTNEPSYKTAEAIGMHFECEYPDEDNGITHVSSIRRADWEYFREEKRILRTQRLILRRWEDSDAEDLYKYAGDPDIGLAVGWPPHKSVDESLDVIRNVLSGREAYAICLKEDGKAIGVIELKLNGYTGMTDRDDECEMGYWIGKPFWGRGIMPEAVREMLRHAFEDCGMQKVWICYYDGNEKSRRVQEKCGFKYQWRSENVDVPLLHEKRTGHVSLMTKEDWISMKENEFSFETDGRIIAACGNDCAACPRYIVHPYEKKGEELHHTAELWMKIGYRAHVVSNEEIACNGCKPENWCRYRVIKCCEDRGIKTCGECSEYPCDNMKECFEVTRSFEPMCRQVSSDEEYRQLKKAFFEKEKNLAGLLRGTSAEKATQADI